MPYPDGAIKGTFNSSSIISEPVPAFYGAALIDPFTGEWHPNAPLVYLHLLAGVPCCHNWCWTDLKRVVVHRA